MERRSRERSGKGLDGWFERLETHGDLDRTLAEVESVRGWRAQVLLAKVLSFQCRATEATEAFEKARASEPQSSGSSQLAVVRRHLARASELEHEMVFGDADSTEAVDVRELVVAAEYDEIAANVLIRIRGLNAARDVYLGEFDRALDEYMELLEIASVDAHALRSLWLCGLAAVEENLGERESALVRLECAGWHANCVDGVFTAARQAARLASLYIYFRRSKDADTWVRRLEQLPCPRKTKRDMGNRAARLVTASRQRDWLVVS